MRAIAKEAGVSVGNAYYYFAGKEHLIQGFYDRIAAEHQAAVRPVLDRETRPGGPARGGADGRGWTSPTPYHEFAVQFFKNAADPDSPLSPFSPESEHAREEAIAVHREVLAGSKAKVPEELRDVLPELMWLSQMGLVLYWVFDRTEGRERSYRLAERGARLTTRGVALARFRVLRPLVREVHELFTDFLPGMTKTLPDPAKKQPPGPADRHGSARQRGRVHRLLPRSSSTSYDQRLAADHECRAREAYEPAVVASRYVPGGRDRRGCTSRRPATPPGRAGVRPGTAG